MADAISEEIARGPGPLDAQRLNSDSDSEGEKNESKGSDEAKIDNQRYDEAILDMSQWMSRAALESVGQGILGYSFDPLNSPSTNRYTRAVRELMCVVLSSHCVLMVVLPS